MELLPLNMDKKSVQQLDMVQQRQLTFPGRKVNQMIILVRIIFSIIKFRFRVLETL